jgi:hypothetical protein
MQSGRLQDTSWAVVMEFSPFSTFFVNTIDAPSLALVVPVVHS